MEGIKLVKKNLAHESRDGSCAIQGHTKNQGHYNHKMNQADDIKDVEFHYLGLDVSPESIETARTRARTAVKASGQLTSADFRVADFTNFEGVHKEIFEWARARGLEGPNCFQIISSQMALHYCFETEAKAENFARICRSVASVETGALFVGTTVDSETVRARISSAGRAVSASSSSMVEGGNNFPCPHGGGGTHHGSAHGNTTCGNSLYRIKFLHQRYSESAAAASNFSSSSASKGSTDLFLSSSMNTRFGNAYDFTLHGAINNCREYAVDESILEELLLRGRDTITHEQNGDGLYNFAGENFNIFGKRLMGLRTDTCPAARFFGKNLMSLARALRNLAEGPAYRIFDSANQAFNLSTDSQEVCGLYRVVLARIPPSAEDTAAIKVDEEMLGVMQADMHHNHSPQQPAVHVQGLPQ